MLGTWHFILTLDDSTGHYIIATSAPLDLLKNTSEKKKFKWCVQIKINNNLPHMICCESIVQTLGTWHFILTLNDSTSHYIIATSAPLDLLKKTSEK